MLFALVFTFRFHIFLLCKKHNCVSRELPLHTNIIKILFFCFTENILFGSIIAQMIIRQFSYLFITFCFEGE